MCGDDDCGDGGGEVRRDGHEFGRFAGEGDEEHQVVLFFSVMSVL